MKRIGPIVIIIVVSLFAIPTFAKKRTFDHIGNFNFRVEISGVSAGHVILKSTKPQTDVKCPTGNTAKFVFSKAPTKAQMTALKNKSTYKLTLGDEALTLSGCNAPTYFKDDRVLTFSFDTCK